MIEEQSATEPSAEVQMRRWSAIMICAVSLAIGCHRNPKEGNVLTQQEMEHAIAGLRAAYAAFNRGDIDAAVDLLDPHVEWIEPMEFPGGGAYSGIAGAKRYLTQSRAGAAEVISEPERFIPSGDQIVVFVHARVRPKLRFFGIPHAVASLGIVMIWNRRLDQLKRMRKRHFDVPSEIGCSRACSSDRGKANPRYCYQCQSELFHPGLSWNAQTA